MLPYISFSSCHLKQRKQYFWFCSCSGAGWPYRPTFRIYQVILRCIPTFFRTSGLLINRFSRNHLLFFGTMQDFGFGFGKVFKRNAILMGFIYLKTSTPKMNCIFHKKVSGTNLVSRDMICQLSGKKVKHSVGTCLWTRKKQAGMINFSINEFANGNASSLATNWKRMRFIWGIPWIGKGFWPASHG